MRGLSPNLYILVSVSNLYTIFPRSVCLFCCRGKYVDPSWEYLNGYRLRHMNVEIGTEAAQFLFWEYIKGIFVAVLSTCCIRRVQLSLFT
jgi:hypothetical protein